MALPHVPNPKWTTQPIQAFLPTTPLRLPPCSEYRSTLSAPSNRVFRTVQRRARLPSMSTENPNDLPDEDKTLMERESETPEYSFWGVASFAIIFAIFALSMFATLSRDFIPGGLTVPAGPV